MRSAAGDQETRRGDEDGGAVADAGGDPEYWPTDAGALQEISGEAVRS